MKKILSVVVILSFVITLFACSNKPSDEALRAQVIEYLLKDNHDKLYTVENFRKVNGFQNDPVTYTAQVQYDLVFKVDWKDAPQYMGEQPNGGLLRQGIAALGMLALTAQYGNFKAGDRITEDEKVVLIKTEQGWRLKEEFLNEK